ncbi:MAG: CHASE2 domain-containing protein [Lachnospiraceae bacterium]|nr:CHASE2 domain-containing protein [Lachnospiraceae bacterium]
MKKSVYSVFLILFVAAIWLAVTTNPFYPVDTFVTDRLYSRLEGVNQNIIIVGVDEETLSEYGNFNLWSRDKIAELVNKLYEDEENAPAVVGIDYIFSDPLDEESDKALVDACTGRNVIVGTNVVFRGAVEIDEDGNKYYNKEHISNIEMPYDALKAVTLQGFTNQYISTDGYVRCTRNLVYIPKELQDMAGNVQDSFGYSIYKAYEEQIGGQVVTPDLDSSSPFMFIYSGESGEFPKVSMNAVLSDKVPVTVFKDAIVLIGAYAPGFQDSYQPSSDRGKVMYGIEIHANILQAYMEGKTMVIMDRFLLAGIISLIIVLFIILFRKKVLFITIPVSLLIAIIYALFGRFLSGHGIYISCIYMFLALACADLYFIIEKYLLELIANINYQKEIKEQMWSFTEAMATAIDQRTPYNATHTRNVAKYCGMIADHINKLHSEGKEEDFFSERRKEQLVLAALLHDIGKIAIPLSVMNKETRLDGREEGIADRLYIYKLQARIELLEGSINEADYNDLVSRCDEALKIMTKINGSGFVNDELHNKLQEVLEYSYVNSKGEEKSFFTTEEKECLNIIKGTLTDKEREIMESHVVITGKILEKVHFDKYFEQAPILAVQHHETLDGKGYPNNLTEDELSPDARIIAVADICDALLASDRPYKKPLPKEQAFGIMRNMVRDGKIDGKYVEYLFECVMEENETQKV